MILILLKVGPNPGIPPTGRYYGPTIDIPAPLKLSSLKNWTVTPPGICMECAIAPTITAGGQGFFLPLGLGGW